MKESPLHCGQVHTEGQATGPTLTYALLTKDLINVFSDANKDLSQSPIVHDPQAISYTRQAVILNCSKIQKGHNPKMQTFQTHVYTAFFLLLQYVEPYPRVWQNGFVHPIYSFLI
jgi:hypothetical protein